MDNLNPSFEMIEVYEYYDEPILFLCYITLDKRPGYYMVTLFDMGKNFTSWLYSPVTPEQIGKIRSGEMSLQDAFKRTGSPQVALVTCYRYHKSRPAENRIRWITPESINADMLAQKDERLSLTTPLILMREGQS